MKRHVVVAALVLLLGACGGGGGDGGGDDVEVTAGCDVPLAGQCATLITTQATWDRMDGDVAWAEQCAAGAAGHAGTVVPACPAESRVGHCTVTISSATASAVVVYGYYAPAFTLEQAAEACATIHGTFGAE
jgi:hypothetical protein